MEADRNLFGSWYYNFLSSPTIHLIHVLMQLQLGRNRVGRGGGQVHNYHHTALKFH